MFGIVVAAHGNLANALLSTAHLIVGHPSSPSAVGITVDDVGSVFESNLRLSIDSMLTKFPQVLVITDMLGGTPANISLTMHQSGHVEILTGANLSMLIKAMQLCSTSTDLNRAATLVKEAGIQAIALASEVLGGNSLLTNSSSPLRLTGDKL